MVICFTSMLSPWDRGSGGGQLIVHNLANGLVRLGHEVYVVCASRLKGRAPSRPKAEYTPIFVKFFEKRSLNIFSVGLKVYRLAKTKRLDVVHGTGPEAGLLGFLIDKRIKFISSTYNPNVPDLGLPFFFRHPRIFLEKIFNLKLFYLEKLALRTSALVIGISKFSLRNIRQNYQVSEKKMRLVYCGVDPTLFFPATEKERETPAKEILFIGRLDAQKGIDTLIQAFYLIKDKFNIRLRLLGSGWKKQEYLKNVSDLAMTDKVVFEDWVVNSEVPAFLNRASLFAMPSRYESFGLVLLEALSCGVPVVSTNVGSIPEIIADRKTGLLVPPEDAQALATAISELLGDEKAAAELAHNGRRVVFERFTWDRSAKNLEFIYRGAHEKA